ncbi:endonuclease III domain-containing protein [Candidatus Woesearchaeota archaeon]|nr:endonuclease III domain-containing protein [Candidatus Woesearchaeota archaeon]
MNKIEQIYHKLLKEYGPQGWWPRINEKTLLCEYHKGDYGFPRTDAERFEVCVGALLTQNTQWRPNVERAMIELKRLNLIDIDRILKAKHEVIADAIKSSGYFNQKARKLKNIAEFLKKHTIRELEKMELWQARDLLLGINGVGAETADSILLYALHKPIFVVDAYTKRIFANLGFIRPDATYDQVQRLFMDNLEHDTRLFNEYHALIVEHAKNHYRKKSEYHLCPLYKKYRVNR